jgi:prepilin-type N-terminal cleavage/methylation domain-containing protein
MRLRHNHKRGGFTLAELLLSMSLMALLMLAAAFAIYAAETAHAFNSQKNELVTRARGVVDRVSLDVRRCTSYEVLDASTVAIHLPSGLTHTYQYSTAGGGTILYYETDLLLNQTTPTVMTGYVQSFVVTDDAPSCVIQIALKGTLAEAQVNASATPGKALF